MKRTIAVLLVAVATAVFGQTPIPPGRPNRPPDSGAAFGFYAFRNGNDLLIGRAGTDRAPGFKHTWIQIGNGRYIYTTERIAGAGPITPIRDTAAFHDTSPDPTLSITQRTIIPGRPSVDAPMVLVPVVEFLCH